MICPSNFKFINFCLAFVLAIGCAFAAGTPSPVFAAAAGLSATYSQDFDSLPSTGANLTWINDSSATTGTLPGWIASRNRISADSGTSGSGGMYSYGALNSTERAFGALPKKNSGGTIYKGLLLYNDSPQTIQNLYIAYTGEQWRNSGGGTQTLGFSYQVSATAITSLTNGSWATITGLDFLAPVTGGTAGALDGNLPANQTRLSAVVPVNVESGSYLMLRWTDSDDRGADHGLAVDDLVVSRNLPPSAAPDAFSTAEDTALTITAADLLANDNDPENDPLSARLAAQAEHGALVENGDGSYTYTPDANWSGSDRFTYFANDGNLNSPAVDVTLAVSAVNDDPVAGDQTLSTGEDTGLTGALTATDIDSTTLTFAKETDPAHGSVIVEAAGAFTYTPEADFNGSDSFTFTVSDGNGGSDSAAISITVDPVADAPVATGQSLSTNEDETLAGTLTAADADGDLLTFAKETDPSHGTLSIDADGAFTYTPNTDFNGHDSFTFTVSDGNGGSGSGTIDITVDPVNDAPVLLDAVPDQHHLARTPYSFAVSAYFADVDSADVLTFGAQLLDGSPLPDWLNFNPVSGILSGTPTNGEIGSYSIRVIASDGSATVSDDFDLTVGQNQFQLFIPMVRR